MDIKEFVVDENFINCRLDVFVSKYFEDKSRSYIQKLIDAENIKVNGHIKKSNYKLKLKETVSVNIPKIQEATVEPENIELNILYEDSDLMVINKAQGMVVHPAPGNYTGTLVNALLYHCKNLSDINGDIRPGIVHRIDKDTSGVLVVAKNNRAHEILAEQLKEHSMKREYIALVEGRIKNEKGTIDEPLARNPKNRIKIGIVEGGKRAVTHYEVLKRYAKNTLVKCILETGRTHQIRVHMGHIGHQVVGDPVYGFKKQKFNLKGQMLHAEKLGFIHPSSGEYMEFQVDAPEYFENILKKLVEEE